MRTLIPILFFLFISFYSIGQTSVEKIRSGKEKADKGEIKKAFYDFDLAVTLDDSSAEALYYRGYMKYLLEDHLNAISDFDMAIALDSQCVELFYLRGNAHFDLKDFKTAIEDYSKALALDSTDSEIYYNRAIAKYNNGERETLCADLDFAAELKAKLAEDARSVLCK